MNREQRTPSEFWPIRNLPNCLFQNQISNLLSQTATISLDIFIGSRIEFRRGWLRKNILLPMLLILKSTYRHWCASNFLTISTATHLLNRKAKKKNWSGQEFGFFVPLSDVWPTVNRIPSSSKTGASSLTLTSFCYPWALIMLLESSQLYHHPSFTLADGWPTHSTCLSLPARLFWPSIASCLPLLTLIRDLFK